MFSQSFCHCERSETLSACGVTEYEKKELYQYDKQITLEEKRREGTKDEKYSIAKSLKTSGLDNQFISEHTGLSIKEIRKLRPDGEKL